MNLIYAVRSQSLLKSCPSYLKSQIRLLGYSNDRYKPTDKNNKQRNWRFPKRVSDTRQIYDYFLVLDFEATCLENEKIAVQEIIEFPCIKVNAITMEPEAVFHQYILPTVNPQLSHFCTKLTGITQEMVDGQGSFKETLAHFDAWRAEHNLLNNKSAFVTSGDWDLQFLLPHQCRNEGVSVPKYCSSWINIKQAFSDAMGHYPRGIIDMINRLNLKHCGRLHSGIDDCRNITKILQKLASEGHIFHKSGFSLPPKVTTLKDQKKK